MNLTWLYRLLTPCPSYLQDLGTPRELAGIHARAQRCRETWRHHLARSQDFIIRRAEACQSHRRAVILGSGLLLDVPIDALLKRFEEVWLVDLLHFWPVRWSVRNARHARLISLDVTGVLAPLVQQVRIFGRHGKRFTLPSPHCSFLLDHKDLDLVVSLNMLSQLFIAPTEYLDGLKSPDGEHLYSAQELHHYGQEIVLMHLRWLQDLPCRHVALMTDYWRRVYNPDGTLNYQESMLERLPLELTGETWEWHIAPPGELDPVLDFYHDVVAIEDVRRVDLPNR